MRWRWSQDLFTSKCLEYDKWTHAGGSALCFSLVYWLLSDCPLESMRVSTAAIIVALGGIFIEVWQALDYYEDGFSWRDLCANLAGLLIAIVAVLS